MSIASEYMHVIIMAYSYAIEKFHEATREITKAEWFDITPRYDLARIKMLQKDAEEKANHIADLYPYLYDNRSEYWDRREVMESILED